MSRTDYELCQMDFGFDKLCLILISLIVRVCVCVRTYFYIYMYSWRLVARIRECNRLLRKRRNKDEMKVQFLF